MVPRQARLESGLKSARLLPKIQDRAKSRERHDYRAYRGSDRGGVAPNVALPPRHEMMIRSFRRDRGDEPPTNPRQHPHLQIASPHTARQGRIIVAFGAKEAMVRVCRSDNPDACHDIYIGNYATNYAKEQRALLRDYLSSPEGSLPWQDDKI